MDAADDCDVEKSAEEIIQRRKQLTDLRASMVQAGISTSEVDAGLGELPEAPKPTPLPKIAFYEAEKAVHKAEQELKDIARHAQLQRDMEAAQKARAMD